MPKDSACLWNTGLFYQMTCWGCHMACAWHSVQDNRAWVHAWFCPRGWDDRIRACLFWGHWLVWSCHCGALSLDSLRGAFFKFSTNTEQDPGKERLRRAAATIPGREEADKLRDLGFKSGEASAEPRSPQSPVHHHWQQQEQLFNVKDWGLNVLCSANRLTRDVQAMLWLKMVSEGLEKGWILTTQRKRSVFFYILKAKKISGSSPMIFSCQKHGLWICLPSLKAVIVACPWCMWWMITKSRRTQSITIIHTPSANSVLLVWKNAFPGWRVHGL